MREAGDAHEASPAFFVGLLERRGIPLVLAAVVAAYAGVVHAGFVWDDVPLVLRNRFLAEPGHLGDLLLGDLWDGAPVEQGVSGYFRPLMLLSLWVDRQVFGTWSPGYHLHGLAWHCLATAALMRLVGRLLGWRAGLLGGVIFGLHPVQSEVVVWISARNDAMALALGLLALDAVVGREVDRRQAVVGALFTVLAGLAKESVLLLPVLVVPLERAARGRWRWRPLVPVLGGLALVLELRVAAGVGASAWPPAGGWSLLAHRLHLVAGTVAASLVDPLHLTVGRSLEWLDREPAWRLALGWTVLLLLPAGLLVRRASRRWAVAGLGWMVVVFLPALVPIADKGHLGDRYLYPALAGLGVAAGAVLARRALPVAAGLAVAGLLSLHHRLVAWVDDVSLWSAAVAVEPTPYAWSGLGHALRARGEDEAALVAFRNAVDDPVPDLAACPRLVGTALRLGRPAEAVALAELGVARGCDPTGADPDAGVFAGWYAVALAFTGRWEEAGRVVAAAPPDPEGRVDVVRAAIMVREGDLDAFQALEAAWTGEVPLARQVDRLLGD